MRIAASPFILALLLAACAGPSPAPPLSGPIAGGWSAAPVDAPEIRAAAGFALNCMSAPGRALSRIDAASTQVVAGLNYQLDLTFSDGSRWRAVVYRDLKGELTLTSATPLRMSAARR